MQTVPDPRIDSRLETRLGRAQRAVRGRLAILSARPVRYYAIVVPPAAGCQTEPASARQAPFSLEDSEREDISCPHPRTFLAAECPMGDNLTPALDSREAEG